MAPLNPKNSSSWPASATTENIALAQDGSLSGTVTGEGGAPLAGIEVEVCGGSVFECFTTATEAAGRYSFAELSEGQYSETATPSAHSGYAVTRTQNTVRVNPSQNTTEDVPLTEAGGIHGTVTGVGNAGVANVSINACGPMGATRRRPMPTANTPSKKLPTAATPPPRAHRRTRDTRPQALNSPSREKRV